MRTSVSFAIILVGSFVVLVPLIPAFLLFKFIRSTASVSGPLQGRKVQLGGAFAGYFLVFLSLLGFVRYELQHLAPEEGVALWTVEGTLQLQDADASQDVRSVELLLRPPNPWPVSADGHFAVENVQFLAGRGAASTTLELRKGPTYLPATLVFEGNWVKVGGNRYLLRVDSAARKIFIDSPIVLRQVTVPLGSVPNSQVSVPEPVGGPP